MRAPCRCFRKEPSLLCIPISYAHCRRRRAACESGPRGRFFPARIRRSCCATKVSAPTGRFRAFSVGDSEIASAASFDGMDRFPERGRNVVGDAVSRKRSPAERGGRVCLPMPEQGSRIIDVRISWLPRGDRRTMDRPGRSGFPAGTRRAIAGGVVARACGTRLPPGRCPRDRGRASGICRKHGLLSGWTARPCSPCP